MHISQTEYQGNPNIGLFGFANDKFCLVGRGFRSKALKEMEEVLKVPIYQITLCGTDLVGVFCAGNNDCIVVPDLVQENELKVLDELGIKYEVIKTDFTAFGNNILCNDFGALVNPEFSARVKKLIRTALKVTLHPASFSELDIVGSLCVTCKDKAIISNFATDEDVKHVEELLQVKTTKATVNFGSQFLRSAIIANKNGFVIGTGSTGVELNDIDEALGFIN